MKKSAVWVATYGKKTVSEQNNQKVCLMKILQINSSARTSGSNSTRLADAITTRLQGKYPAVTITVRDLAKNTHPVLDESALMALFTPVDQRSFEQKNRVAQDEALISEVLSADALVLGVPMYNFGISVQLKTWIDAIAKPGVTFRYTDQGPKGLITGKKVYVALARGGLFRDTAADLQVPFLKNVLGFLGMTDVEFVFAEGLSMGPEAVDRAFAEAQARINQL
jgi:FMN-dependent NADH-azoreductase